MSNNIKSIISIVLIAITSGCISTKVSPAFKLQIVNKNGVPVSKIKVKQIWEHQGVGGTFHKEILFTNQNGMVSFPARIVTKDIFTRSVWFIWRMMWFWNPRFQWGPYMYVSVDSEQGEASFMYYEDEKTIPKQLVLEKE